MDLKEILRMIRLEGIQRIAVTGPYHSGTDIGAAVLANELNYNFIPETDGDDFEAFSKKSRLATEPFVIECPGMLRHGLRFPADMLIIFVYRPLVDILASQRKHGFSEADEKDKYLDLKCFDMLKPIAHIQWRFAELFISPSRRIEYLDFDSLPVRFPVRVAAAPVIKPKRGRRQNE